MGLVCARAGVERGQGLCQWALRGWEWCQGRGVLGWVWARGGLGWGFREEGGRGGGWLPGMSCVVVVLGGAVVGLAGVSRCGGVSFLWSGRGCRSRAGC